MEYMFTLKYQLQPGDDDHSSLVERLGSDGCDDALVGIGLPGRIALEFVRESETAEAALLSALADVKRTIPTAKLIEVSPDFVGLTEAADVAGVTRQNMRKLMITHQSRFPPPIHEGSSSIWHLADILDWLQTKGGYDLDQKIIDVAHAANKINEFKNSNFSQPCLVNFGRVDIDTEAVMRRLEKGRKEAAKIIDSMKQRGVTVQLFGSMKTGNAFPNSDIDLLVTDCGPLDPEVVLVDIHAMENEIPIDVMLLQFVPEKSLRRVMESVCL